VAIGQAQSEGAVSEGSEPLTTASRDTSRGTGLRTAAPALGIFHLPLLPDHLGHCLQRLHQRLGLLARRPIAALLELAGQIAVQLVSGVPPAHAVLQDELERPEVGLRDHERVPARVVLQRAPCDGGRRVERNRAIRVGPARTR
jgi:hypothetical protein